MSGDAMVGIAFVSILGGLGLFFLMRSIMLWYFKINTVVEQNDEIIRLLKLIAKEKPGPITKDGKE